MRSIFVLLFLLPMMSVSLWATPAITSGLVAYYSFDGNANDSSGHGLNGTLQGDPNLVSGAVNQAYNFDGNGDYIAVANNSAFAISGGLTMAAWIKFNTDPYSIGQSRSYILDKMYAWRLWYSANGEGTSSADEFYNDVWDWDGANSATASNFWQVDTWYHITATYNGTQARVYVNGELSGTRNFSKGLRTSGNGLTIGANSNGGDLFNGAIDEVAIYSRALSNTEVSQLATIPEPSVCLLLAIGVTFFYKKRRSTN